MSNSRLYSGFQKSLGVPASNWRVNMIKRRINVLIVDDEPAIRDSLSRILDQKGCITMAVRGGKEALDVLPAFSPDVVILDLIMPGMDGYEVCRRLRLSIPNVKVVYFTAKVEVGGVNESSIGPDALIEKPASSDRIFSCIQKLMLGDSKSCIA